MGSRFFQRPENAISKAEEFINVGKPVRALDTLYDVIKSKKRHHNFSEKLIEQIMFKYLELCVDLKKSHIAKEGLFQYRNMCQLTNVASLASVVQGYLTMAEQRTEKARKESAESAAEVDDLDNLNTPEMIMLSAVSGEDAQDRSDRKILMPWVKFLWESYCQCLELLRTNLRVERLYHDIAQQAFRFCLKYQRKTEFRKLCDKLRNHLELVVKQTPSQMSINLNNAETQQMNLDTRLAQLDAAIKMELWQEAYKAVEDIHGLMTMSKKVFQPKMMANYYQKLALVFWKSGNHLFHAAAVFKHFQLTREMKKNISTEEQGKMASLVLGACLAVPVPSHHPEFDKFIETDRTPQEKMARLAVLLSLPQPPTRQSLLKDAARFGVVSAATEPLQDLHKWLEVEFHPLLLCKRVEATLKLIEEDDEKSQLQQYLPALREITLVRLLKQVSQVYQSICFKRLLDLAPFATSFELERVIVDCVRHNDMQIRVDHRSRTVHFGTELAEAQSISETEGPHLQDMPSEQIRTQLMKMLEVMDKSLKAIHPDKVKIENNALRQKIVDAYHQSKKRDHQRILERHKLIEERKEYLERLSISRTEEEQRKQENALLEKQRQETARLAQEREEMEKARAKEKLLEIQQQHMKEKIQQIMQTQIGRTVVEKMDEEELANLDTDTIMMKQVEELENEKRLLVARLKAQEKKMDHMERAKRKVEIPLLKEAIKKDLEDDTELWKKKEKDRIVQSIKDRDEAVANRDRLERMKEDKDNFMATLLTQRKEKFDKKLKEYNKMFEEQRAIRLEEKKAQRKEERRQKYLREQEEEEQRRRDEELKRIREEKAKEEAERKAREEEEYRKRKEALDRIAEKQMEREKQIEEKLMKEQQEARREREEESRKQRGGSERSMEKEDTQNWRGGRGGNDERDREEGGSRFRRDNDDKPKEEEKGRPGGWRDREKRKMDQWGPPKEREDDRRGNRDRDMDRAGPPRGGADAGGWRRDDRRDDRPPPDRDGDRRGDRGGRRFDDRDRDVERGPPRRGGEGEDSWRRPNDRNDRGPPRGDRDGPPRGGRDDRGPREDRGPRGDNRGPRGGDDRGPRRDDRGGRDDRGPSDWRSGPRKFDRDDKPQMGNRDRRDDRGGRGEGGDNWRSGPRMGDRDKGGPRNRGPPAEDKPRGGDQSANGEDGEWKTVSKR